MLTLTFLGVGDMAARRNFQSNALVEAWTAAPVAGAEPADTLLIDFGITGPAALHQLAHRPGFEYLRFSYDVGGAAPLVHADCTKLRRIVITHQHTDHFGGLEDLAIVLKFGLSRLKGVDHRPELISGAEVLTSLWEGSLRGGLGTALGRATRFEDFFQLRPLPQGADGLGPVELAGGYRVWLIPTDHTRVKRKHDVPAYGLLFDEPATGRTAYYSGDTRLDIAEHGARFDHADVIFHDCLLRAAPDAVHAPIGELRALPEPIRRKMVLYHYSDDWDDPRYAFVAAEFRGFARPQERYTLLA